MSRRKPYTVDELRLKDGSEEEQIRTRGIFEQLKIVAQAKGFMTEYEKNFFCLGVKISLLNDGQVADYQCCADYRFKDLYLTYAANITGAGIYKKIHNTQYLPVLNEEKWAALEKLYKLADEWEKVISITNHKDQLLQKCSKETRSTINAINELPEFNLNIDPFARGKFLYKYKKWSNLLHSRFIYLMAKEIIQGSSPADFLFNLCGKTIEMDEYSIIHILSRHYAKVAKRYDTGKFYIQEDFKPRELHNQFREIIAQIDSSGLLQPNNISKIPFLYKKIPYLIWIKEENKQIKSQKNNIKLLRLETFYPVEDQNSLNDLINNYELKIIDDNLSLYTPN